MFLYELEKKGGINHRPGLSCLILLWPVACPRCGLPELFPHVGQQGDIHIYIQVMKLTQSLDMKCPAYFSQACILLAAATGLGQRIKDNLPSRYALLETRQVLNAIVGEKELFRQQEKPAIDCPL